MIALDKALFAWGKERSVLQRNGNELPCLMIELFWRNVRGCTRMIYPCIKKYDVLEKVRRPLRESSERDRATSN